MILRPPSILPQYPPRPGNSPSGFPADLPRSSPGSLYLRGGRTSKLSLLGRTSPLLSGNKFWSQFCCSSAGRSLASHLNYSEAQFSKETGILAHLPQETAVC